MIKYRLPFYEEDNGANGGGSATGTGEVATTQNNSLKTSSTQANTGVAVQKEEVPDGHQPSTAWADMRKKAQKADELEKEISSYRTKFEKLNKALPEGFNSLDEYLEALETNVEQAVTQQQHNAGNFDEKTIQKIVEKTIETNPAVKSVKEQVRNQYLVKSFKEVQEKFSDIKEAKDIPIEVWDAWDEGASGRTLLSHLKEYRYDNDIVEAKKQGASSAASQKASTSHLNQAQGSTQKTEHESIVVPEEVKRNFEKAGIKDPDKQKMYYKKYHRE